MRLVERAEPGTVLTWLGLLLLPWYALEDGFFALEWLSYWPSEDSAPALFCLEQPWLVVYAVLALFGLWPRARTFAGLLGLGYGALQGSAIGALGWQWQWLEQQLGPLHLRQLGMGMGAAAFHIGCLFWVADGAVRRGALRGDRFVGRTLALIVASLGLFVFLPVFLVLTWSVRDDAGDFAPMLLFSNLFSDRLFGLSPPGVVWRSLFLAVASAAGSTLIGLACALLLVRGRLWGRTWLRWLGIIPIITPPFVLGLALILFFGRAGLVSQWLETHLGIPASRGLFGFTGIWIAQLLAFSPVAFLVLVGVIEGVAPSLEEAAATLRASPNKIFFTVTLPLLRPGIANAFLLGFIESLADFGNPMVLGGDYEVLATEIYYSVTGAQGDVARAAALALVLLALTFVAYLIQKRWLGDRSYVTVTGKGDPGLSRRLPPALEWGCRMIAVPWVAFSAMLYVALVVGGLFENFGLDHHFTWRHFERLFGAQGAAWPSLRTTVFVAAFSAPLTALLGVAIAYLLQRQSFWGRPWLAACTLLSFAIPGTVVGLAYVLTFNTPPLEFTGTAFILVMCFAFRNVPVGERAATAALLQLDKTLDEASLTLGANTATTARRILLPLLRPALLAALVYGFVRSMTAISAVVFLVSAEHDLATTYILGRVESGEYGPAIAYSAFLIIFMVVVIGLLKLLVGQRHLGRRP